MYIHSTHISPIYNDVGRPVTAACIGRQISRLYIRIQTELPSHQSVSSEVRHCVKARSSLHHSLMTEKSADESRTVRSNQRASRSSKHSSVIEKSSPTARSFARIEKPSRRQFSDTSNAPRYSAISSQMYTRTRWTRHFTTDAGIASERSNRSGQRRSRGSRSIRGAEVFLCDYRRMTFSDATEAS